MRVFGLYILNSIVEARGLVLVEVPEIRKDIQTYLCKFLLLSMQTKNLGNKFLFISMHRK